MPFINIKVLEGTLSKEKKADMIKKVTEVVASIETDPYPKENLVPHTWCVIEEVPFENWGIGGNQLAPGLFKAIREKK